MGFLNKFFEKKADALKAPGHIAFICDGNGRWAKRRGLPRTAGHSAGVNVFEPLVRFLMEHGAHTITFFVFSTENWNRSKTEVDFLMNLMTRSLKSHEKMAAKENVRLKFIGRRDRLPKSLFDEVIRVEAATEENTRGTICFALDFGGQDEIVRATQNIIADGVAADDITPALFNTYLDSGELTPIDLLVRTSGEHRISNFMLWNMAYAEMAFIPELWPSINNKVLTRLLHDFNARDRRFGGVKE
jgi:undecaprenyl diphosphate synthase